MLIMPSMFFDFPFIHADWCITKDKCSMVVASSSQSTSACPLCGQPGFRVHSRYKRKATDLPWGPLSVIITLQVRRFFCDNPICPRQIFSERLSGFIQPYARRTDRLGATLRDIAHALGGEAGMRLVKKLFTPVSADTLLRIIRREFMPVEVTPRILGVDEWLYRRNHHYGTILVDLERRRPVDLLPDREGETLAAWLIAHPGVEIVSRDRGGSYAEGIRKGAPDAQQVADRWHLLKNMRETVERVLNRNHTALYQVAEEQAAKEKTEAKSEEQSSTSKPSSTPILTRQVSSAEQARLARRQRRLDRYNQVISLHQQGISIAAIARQMKMGRRDVRRFIRAGTFPERAQSPERPSKLDPFLPYLKQRWAAGCHSAAELWREVKLLGFTGSQNLVRRAVRPWREGLPNGPSVAPQSAVKPPSSHQTTWWLLGLDKEKDDKKKAVHQGFIDILLNRFPELKKVQTLAKKFFDMIHKHQPVFFEDWLTEAKNSGVPELEGFATGIVCDKAAVLAAITYPWSNGQVEGQINRLKVIKRQMYGRANFDLIKIRVLRPP